MGQPVVHFEVVGKDGDKLKSYYAEMFDWEVKDDNPMKYGLVDAARGLGRRRASAAGSARAPRATRATSPSTSRCPTSRRRCAKAESLGGTRVMGPETIMEGITLGQFLDPEGNVVGLTQARLAVKRAPAGRRRSRGRTGLAGRRQARRHRVGDRRRLVARQRLGLLLPDVVQRDLQVGPEAGRDEEVEQQRDPAVDRLLPPSFEAPWTRLVPRQ